MGTAKTNIQSVKFKRAENFPDSVILTEGHLCRL